MFFAKVFQRIRLHCPLDKYIWIDLIEEHFTLNINSNIYLHWHLAEAIKPTVKTRANNFIFANITLTRMRDFHLLKFLVSSSTIYCVFILYTIPPGYQLSEECCRIWELDYVIDLCSTHAHMHIQKNNNIWLNYDFKNKLLYQPNLKVNYH